MPRPLFCSLNPACHYSTDLTDSFTSRKALKNYLFITDTVLNLAHHIMTTPLIVNVKILQKELENGMLAYNHTLSERTVSLREGFNSELDGFMHSSYSCDILIRSKDLFDCVVNCAGVFASQKWLTERPLPAQLTSEEVHRLRFYYEQVIKKFEAAIEKDWTWVKELDAN